MKKIKTYYHIYNTVTNMSANISTVETVIPLSVLFIMDASGSMASMGNEPLQGLNNLIKQQKETGEFKFTLVTFNETVKTVINDMNGKDVPILTSDHYSPDGMTALLDAMGEAITMQKERKIDNVLVVVLTDGLENASRRFNASQIKELTTEMKEKYKWAFMYLGANQDSFSVAKGLGINVSTDYDYSPAGCNQLFRGISHEISRCVSGETTTDNFKPNLDFGVDKAQPNNLTSAFRTASTLNQTPTLHPNLHSSLHPNLNQSSFNFSNPPNLNPNPLGNLSVTFEPPSISRC